MATNGRNLLLFDITPRSNNRTTAHQAFTPAASKLPRVVVTWIGYDAAFRKFLRLTAHKVLRTGNALFASPKDKRPFKLGYVPLSVGE